MPKGRELLIPLHEILYIESKIRQIHMFTTEGITKYYGILNKEEHKLPKGEFVRTHQSYIVNLRHVKIVSSENLTLIDNKKIPISNSRRRSVKDRYMEYRRSYFE